MIWKIVAEDFKFDCLYPTEILSFTFFPHNSLEAEGGANGRLSTLLQW